MGTNLVVQFDLPYNGGKAILEGVLEFRQSDEATFSEDTTYCLLREDSTEFDSRECSIPLSSLRLDDAASNAY